MSEITLRLEDPTTEDSFYLDLTFSDDEICFTMYRDGKEKDGSLIYQQTTWPLHPDQITHTAHMLKLMSLALTNYSWDFNKIE